MFNAYRTYYFCFFCWSSFLSLPGLFLKASKQESSDLRSESYLQVRHLFTKYSPSPPDFLLFLKKKRKTIQPLRCSQCHSDPRHPYWSSWLAGSASGDLGVPQKSWPFGKPNRGFQQKNDLSILKQQCRFNTPGNWWCARKLTNHRSKVTQSLTSNRVVLKFP